MNWRVSLETIERVVVIVAAFLAVFPLWQYISEADSRKIERQSNFIVAYNLCLDQFTNGADKDSVDFAHISAFGLGIMTENNDYIEQVCDEVIQAGSGIWGDGHGGITSYKEP